MSPQIVKEFRPLALPWGIATAIGLVSLFGVQLDSFSPVRLFVFFGGAALLAAMPFGIEFQQRTFQLLLSQPAKRSQLWDIKLVTVLLAVGALALVHALAFGLNVRGPAAVGAVLVMFLLATICSMGFWIPLIRSYAGGVAVAVASQSLLFFGLGYFLLNFYPDRLVFLSKVSVWKVAAAGMVYCALFVWLGRRFWRNKLWLLAGSAALVAATFGLAHALGNNGDGSGVGAAGWVLGATFLGATICSAGFWTLLARSIIGGMAFTVAVQILCALGVGFGAYQLFGIELRGDDVRATWPFVVSGLIYSGLCLWLGWRKFAGMELRSASAAEAPPTATAAPITRWWLGWLRCRPERPWWNLVRKEIILLKPLFTIAALFVLCWFANLGALVLKPEYHLENLHVLLASLYIPVALLLAGCISLGEEHNLGLAAWSLTLPISARCQWFVKLAVSLVTAITLGLVLPGLLIWAANLALLHLYPNQANDAIDWAAFLMVVGLPIFALGFWAATLVSNTVRAALTAVVMFGCLILVTTMAHWLAERSGGLLAGLATAVVVRLQLPPSQLPESVFRFGNFGGTFWIYAAVSLAVTGIALLQSLFGFRRLGSPRLWVTSLALVVSAFAVAFCISDYTCSTRHASSRSVLEGEVEEALNTLPLRQSGFTARGLRTLTVADLEAGGSLSELTRTWLRNASIEIRRSTPEPIRGIGMERTLSEPSPAALRGQQRTQPPEVILRRYGLAPGEGLQPSNVVQPPPKPISSEMCQITIRFPNGREWSFSSLLKIHQ